MNQQLNPGDLCMIINALHSDENIGKTVVVIAPMQPLEVLRVNDEVIICPPYYAGMEVWAIRGESLSVTNGAGGRKMATVGLIRREWLMKLGDGDVLPVKEQEKEHA